MVFSETGLFATFGTTLVAAGTSRHFQFNPRFGCGFAARPDRVGIRLRLRDRRGRVHEKSLSARLE
jgi:hypothetical protein